MKVDSKSVTNSSFTIIWAAPSNLSFVYLPSLSEVGTEYWQNESWTSNTNYTFSNLEPETTYNFTVYVKQSLEPFAYPGHFYFQQTTKIAGKNFLLLFH